MENKKIFGIIIFFALAVLLIPVVFASCPEVNAETCSSCSYLCQFGAKCVILSSIGGCVIDCCGDGLCCLGCEYDCHTCTTSTDCNDGNACTSDICRGGRCQNPPAPPNCACASSTCVGSTCFDGCGNTCAGTKTPNCACASSTCVGSTCPSSNGCGTCAGTKTPNCACASSTCVGQTCPDGCGGICSGTKPPNCNCASTTCVGQTCLNSCGTDTCAGASSSKRICPDGSCVDLAVDCSGSGGPGTNCTDDSYCGTGRKCSLGDGLCYDPETQVACGPPQNSIVGSRDDWSVEIGGVCYMAMLGSSTTQSFPVGSVPADYDIIKCDNYNCIAGNWSTQMVNKGNAQCSALQSSLPSSLSSCKLNWEHESLTSSNPVVTGCSVWKIPGGVMGSSTLKLGGDAGEWTVVGGFFSKEVVTYTPIISISTPIVIETSRIVVDDTGRGGGGGRGGGPPKKIIEQRIIQKITETGGDAKRVEVANGFVAIGPVIHIKQIKGLTVSPFGGLDFLMGPGDATKLKPMWGIGASSGPFSVIFTQNSERSFLGGQCTFRF